MDAAYHVACRQHWLTLGNYPDMLLAQARVEAHQARVLLDEQQNPLAVRRAALAEERQKGSFKSLCEDWYRAEVQARELKHPVVPRRYHDKAARQPEWTDEERQKLIQQQVQGDLIADREAAALRTLRKIPFDFHYRFRSPMEPAGHENRLKIVDWEVARCIGT